MTCTSVGDRFLVQPFFTSSGYPPPSLPLSVLQCEQPGPILSKKPHRSDLSLKVGCNYTFWHKVDLCQVTAKPIITSGLIKNWYYLSTSVFNICQPYWKVHWVHVSTIHPPTVLRGHQSCYFLFFHLYWMDSVYTTMLVQSWRVPSTLIFLCG